MHVVSPPTCTMSLIHIIHKQAKRVKAKHTLFVIEAFCFKKTTAYKHRWAELQVNYHCTCIYFHPFSYVCKHAL